jgi:ferric-dicitrate binding protein FerR (iron transport regulator)
MSNNRLKYLLEQYASDASTPEETRELLEWIKDLKDDIQLREKVKELWTNHDLNEPLPQTDWNTIYARIADMPVIGRQRSVWPRVWAAAAVVALLSAGSYFIFNKPVEQPIAATEKLQPEHKLVPGGDKAVLTLASGEQIVLDSAGNGTLTQQGNIKVIKLNDGRLSYSSSKDKPQEVLYNTISTPRGGQYQVVLADGSKVWLNAASSLHFPVSFTGDKRTVTLSGEGYFEVAHNAAKPFTVSVNGVEVHVLGTHFNINAYDDEGVVKTTLLEGSVKVSKGSVGKTISPGEQAAIENNDNTVNPAIRVLQVDVDAVIAWKDGRFVFKGDNIQSVMRQLSRWYDAEISYEKNVTSEEFVGVINRSRYDNIADILEMLGKTGTVSFDVNGHHIIVMPFKK